jgi:PAS domain S-box-containing protein
LLGVLNLDGCFVHSNSAWQATLGWSAEEIRTTKLLALIHPEDLPRTRAAWEAVKQGQQRASSSSRLPSSNCNWPCRRQAN